MPIIRTVYHQFINASPFFDEEHWSLNRKNGSQEFICDLFLIGFGKTDEGSCRPVKKPLVFNQGFPSWYQVFTIFACLSQSQDNGRLLAFEGLGGFLDAPDFRTLCQNGCKAILRLSLIQVKSPLK